MRPRLNRARNDEGPLSVAADKGLREFNSTNTHQSTASWADVNRLAQPIRYVPEAAFWVAPVCRGRRDVFVAAGVGKSSEALRVASCCP